VFLFPPATLFPSSRILILVRFCFPFTDQQAIPTLRCQRHQHPSFYADVSKPCGPQHEHYQLFLSFGQIFDLLCRIRSDGSRQHCTNSSNEKELPDQHSHASPATCDQV
jgi:hypothetical protein